MKTKKESVCLDLQGVDRASALIQDWLTEAGVKRRVLLPKLIPDFLIGLSTCSSSAAFSTTLEINEMKLGIDPSFSRTAVPIGTIIYAGISSLFLIVSCAYAAECYQVGATWPGGSSSGSSARS